MRNFLKLFVVLIAAIVMLGSCSYDKVPAGYVGIKFYSLGGDKGVDREVVGPGRYLCGPNTTLFNFPTFQQTYVFTKATDEGKATDESFTFQTMEGLEVGADIGITFHVESNKVSNIFQKYQEGIHEIIAVPMRGMIRDGFNQQASKVAVSYVYGEGKVKLIDSVQAYVKRYFDPIGVIVDKIYLVGSFRLPASVTAALNAKLEANQKAGQLENEVAQATAQANKQIAYARGDSMSAVIRAAGEAKANQLKQQTLTPLLIEYAKIQKWNGCLPTVTSGSGMIIDLKGLGK